MFQKNGSGSAAVSGGGKKRLNPSMNLYSEVGSPSSVSQLPPLLDSSISTTNDHESSSYDVVNSSASNIEHVSCFSTTCHHVPPNFNYQSLFELPTAHPAAGTLASLFESSSSRSGRSSAAAAAFPSLRSLQENLHFPFFFPTAAHQYPLNVNAANNNNGGDYGGSFTNCAVPENQKGGCPTELDCMWSF